jgi:hypothetical protein
MLLPSLKKAVAVNCCERQVALVMSCGEATIALFRVEFPPARAPFTPPPAAALK